MNGNKSLGISETSQNKTSIFFTNHDRIQLSSARDKISLESTLIKIEEFKRDEKRSVNLVVKAVFTFVLIFSTIDSLVQSFLSLTSIKQIVRKTKLLLGFELMEYLEGHPQRQCCS